MPSSAAARPRRPGVHTASTALDRLELEVGAVAVPVLDSCSSPPVPCRRSLGRFRSALEALEAGQRRQVRVLHLGDSHIAADFISGYVRDRLQARFGDGGRGLTHADQRWGFGGRRRRRRDADWERPRVVDGRGPGQRYGIFGLALEARRRRARVRYRVQPEDREVEIHFDAGPRRAGFEVRLDGEELATISASSSVAATRVHRLKLPISAEPSAARALDLIALGRGARLFGLGFYTGRPGLIWSSIGPVGADAKVYLQSERASFDQNLRIHEPDLVVLMVGGNDALKIRKGWTNLDRVARDHREVIARLREAVPGIDVLLLAPMDAGRRRGRRVVSKPMIAPVRDLQAGLATELGVGFWDTLAAMGGAGAAGRWTAAGGMAKDLVHPRKAAADLIGRLLFEALGRWYDRPKDDQAL